MTFSKSFHKNEKFCILIDFLKRVIDDKSPLVLITAWHPIGTMTLSESMKGYFIDAYNNDAYVRRYASVSLGNGVKCIAVSTQSCGA